MSGDATRPRPSRPSGDGSSPAPSGSRGNPLPKGPPRGPRLLMRLAGLMAARALLRLARRIA